MRGSGKKGSQNKGLGFASKWVVSPGVWFLRSIWAGTSCKVCKLKNYYVDVAADRNISVYSLKAKSEQANQSGEARSSPVMIHLKKAAKALYQTVLLGQFGYNAFSRVVSKEKFISDWYHTQVEKMQGNSLEQIEFSGISSIHHDNYNGQNISEILNEVDNVGSVSLNNRELANIENVDSLWNTVEGTEMISEAESIMMLEGENGLSLQDHAILRSNLPIPEIYGFYDCDSEELEQGQQVRYIPGIGLVIGKN
jgi:hypothetical protein